MTLTVDDAEAILKEMYDPQRPKFLGYKTAPLLALIPKKTDFKGRDYEIALHWGGNQGASRDFQTAKANKSPGKYNGFFLRRQKDYALGSLSTEAILASEGNEASFLSAVSTEIDNTSRTASRNLAISLTRNHGGSRGKILSRSTNTITLTNKKEISNFEVGMQLQHSATDGTSGSVDTEIAEIMSVNRRAGTFVVDDGTDFDANDFLFREGDFGASLHGFPEWIPSSAPSPSEDFLGTDRSVDSRLYGVYQDYSAAGLGLTKEEALRDMDTILCDEGGEPNLIAMNPYDGRDLVTELGSNIVYDFARSPDMAQIGFKAIVLQSLSGVQQKIVFDRTVPFGEFYMLDTEDWVLATLGTAPRILESLGNKYIWDSDGDSVEFRIGMYGDLGCRAPGHQGRGKFHAGT